LIIHGILHLLGYNDTESYDKRIMKKKENFLVKKFTNSVTNTIVEYDS
jgi:ssRNA-specific RNase YbeY (16S rRNA maturation enzyme)